MNTKILWGVCVMCAGIFSGTAAAAPAGEVMLLTGQGTAVGDRGVVRSLAKGDQVFSGDVINSGFNSYLNIKFSDGGFVLLKPGSRFHIENFSHPEAVAVAPAPTPEPAPAVKQPAPAVTLPVTVVTTTAVPSRAFFRLLKGGFRAVSGLVGKANRNEYRIATPVATIGIRGTDYLAILCDASCAVNPILRQSLPEGVDATDGLIASVLDGSIEVEQDAPAVGFNRYFAPPRLAGRARFSKVKRMLSLRVAQAGGPTVINKDETKLFKGSESFSLPKTAVGGIDGGLNNMAPGAMCGK